MISNEIEDSHQTLASTSKPRKNSSSMPQQKNTRNPSTQISTYTLAPTTRLYSHASIRGNSSSSAEAREQESRHSTGMSWSRWDMNG